MPNDDVAWSERADRVTAGISIVEIRLTEIAAKLDNPRPELPIDIKQFHASPRMVQVQSGVVYHVNYKVAAVDRFEKRVFDASFTLSIIFKTLEDFSAADLQAFFTFGVLDILHPYVRETIHDLTGRMGLGPVAVEVKPRAST
jgi:preprotein translocase subunit SecB